MLLRIYKQTIFVFIVWGDCDKQNSQRFERLRNQAVSANFSFVLRRGIAVLWTLW